MKMHHVFLLTHKAITEKRYHGGFFFLVALILQVPLILNIGYFSHDELQWLALADKTSLQEISWSSWLDFRIFQYRPLTFNLWLLLSYWFGYYPVVMHFLHVLLGTLNALLLRKCLLVLGVKQKQATVAAWLFILLPFVTYTHGWIGTYADLLCLLCILCAFLLLIKYAEKKNSSLFIALPIMGLTALALLSKESAIVFPILLCATLYKIRLRNFIPAFLASSIIVGLYLVFRLDTILHSPQPAGAYSWDIFNIPQRLAEYAVFPFISGAFEVYSLAHHSMSQLILATLCLSIVLGAAFSVGWRWLIALLVGCGVALGPVLILAHTANLYAYLASAYTCGVFALIYSRINNALKIGLNVVLLVVVWHGINIEREIWRIGRLQNHLYTDVAAWLTDNPSPSMIKIQAAKRKDDGVLRRLLHSVPSYRRIPFKDRIFVIKHEDTISQPTHIMQHNGSLISYPEH